MATRKFNQGLIEFIQQSPTPFHAVHAMQQHLLEAGFEQLNEGDSWSLQQGKRYLLTRNDSSIIAFVYGKESLVDNGIRLVGAHTDSPCLRVKPNADIYRHGYWQLGVEVYGGVLLNPWFDRELSLAGRVSVKNATGELHHLLIDFREPLGMIPSLAIHLDREVNNQRSINSQKDLPVLLSVVPEQEKPDFRSLLLEQVKKQHADVEAVAVLDYEMSFYDVQPGCLFGVNQHFIAASRLDNLLSCYVAMQSLISADGSQTCLLICNDHEEVGSVSNAGAQGPMLQHCLQRLLPNVEDMARSLSRSMMISVDNAHGIHPNFADRHDENHGPRLNAGPVIKVNANQRYASNSETQAIFRALCEAHNIPLQAFVVRSDMACGSTIGPITAAGTGIKTLDIGVPTFAMHSIRETAGSEDAFHLYKALLQFNQVEKC